MLQGRKVLFVDPPSVIEEQMIQFLITAQYDAAIIKDVRHVPTVLQRFPNSIVYFNLGSKRGMEEQVKVMTHLLSKREKENLIVGILSYDKNEEIAKKYLMDMGALGGYITLDLGFKKSAQILLKVLEANEAKKNRKFVRVKVPSGKGELNIETDSGKYIGTIIDISIAGMACTFDADFSKGTYLSKLQLRLWGQLVSISGTIAGSRTIEGNTIWVIMFDENLAPETRSKVNNFLSKVMQYEIDQAAEQK